jgi:hypothetical protein
MGRRLPRKPRRSLKSFTRFPCLRRPPQKRKARLTAIFRE